MIIDLYYYKYYNFYLNLWNVYVISSFENYDDKYCV